jgi:dTDP-4-dehydrorhamnose 3,5-epimerase
MEIVRLAIPDVVLLRPRKFEDARGYFSETYNEKQAIGYGLPSNYVQDNISYSKTAGTVRGLHFQRPPHAQDKLVRVLKGRILDVAVDLRVGSPTFGQHVAVELSAESGEQLLVPVGFAHAYCTLEDHTEVFYKVTSHYAPAHDGGVIWNDADLDINWPVADKDALLSDKDRLLPAFRDLPAIFFYEKDRVAA